jgi:hypothetical protein
MPVAFQKERRIPQILLILRSLKVDFAEDHHNLGGGGRGGQGGDRDSGGGGGGGGPRGGGRMDRDRGVWEVCGRGGVGGVWEGCVVGGVGGEGGKGGFWVVNRGGLHTLLP